LFKVAHNSSTFVRKLRSPVDQEGAWSPRLQRADSKEVDTPPFWANRGRRELEELLDSFLASHVVDDSTTNGEPEGLDSVP
jgi:hypothetical protein